MAMLQDDKAIFYHPLDDLTEFLESQAWVGSGSFAAAKVSQGLAGADRHVGPFGAEAEFHTAASAMSVAALGDGPLPPLSATRFVVAYVDDVTDVGRVRVGAVSGADVTFGAARQLRAATALKSNASVAALSAASFAAAFAVAGGAQVVIGTVAGTDITLGPESEFMPAFGAQSLSARDISLAALSASKIVVSYENANTSTPGYGDGGSKVGTVSGLVVTFGAEETFMDGTGIFASAALSASSFVVVYRNEADDHGKARVGMVAGSSVAFGAESEFLAGALGGTAVSVAALSASKVVVAYVDAGDGNGGKARVGAVSGSDVTFGAEATFFDGAAANADYPAVAALDQDGFVVAYTDTTGDDRAAARAGAVSGTDVAFSAEAELLGTRAYDIAVAALSATLFVAAYRDGVDGDHGTAKAGSLLVSASLTSQSAAPYLTSVGATKVAYSLWVRKPS